MTPNLRPMHLGEILDRTFHIYRSRFLVFLAISVMPVTATMAEYGAASVWLVRHPLHGKILFAGLTLPGLLWSTMTYASYGFLTLLFRPLFIRATSDAIRGTRFSLHMAITRMTRRWRTMLALNLAEQTIVYLAPASIFIACVAVLGNSIASAQADQVAIAAAALILLLVMILLAVEYLWVGACVSFSFAAAELEEVSWITALKRSWRLSKKSKGRIVFTWIAVFVGSIVANFLLRWTLHFALRLFVKSPAFWAGFPGYIFTSLLPLEFLGCVIGPIYPIAITLFYYDQRIRREGYDIEQMMEAAGLNPTTATAPAEDSATQAAAQKDHA